MESDCRRLYAAASCILFLAAAAPALDAQTLSGTVRDGQTGAPLSAARVMQVLPDGSLSRAETDSAGRFQLRLHGDAPFDVLVERFGYAARRIEFDRAAVTRDAAEIELWAAPVVLAGLDADVRPGALTWASFDVTDAGLLPRIHGRERCYYLAIDDVVIRDPRLFDPELAGRYQPADAMVPHVSGIWIRPANDVLDQRLRRDAWPCGVVNIVTVRGTRYRNLPTRPRSVELSFVRDNPGTDAPAYDLTVQGSIPLPPELARRDLLFAAADVDRLAVASPDHSFVLILRADGSQEQRHELAGGAAGFKRVTSLGWLADTLWAVDGSTGLIARFPPDGAAPVVRQLPADGGRAGRWLVNRALPDAVWPRRPEDPPATRHLLTLDSALEGPELLAVLRPAPEPLVTGVDDIVQPLRDHTLHARSPDGRHVTIVRRGIDMAVFWSVYSVTRMDARGRPIFQVDRTAPLIRVTDRVITDLTDSLALHPALVGAVPSAAARRALVRGALYRPAVYYPPISDLVVGRDGTTWLRWPDERRRTVRWDVLDPAGQPLRTLSLDYRMRILDADEDGVWALSPDRAGNLALVRYLLRARR